MLPSPVSRSASGSGAAVTRSAIRGTNDGSGRSSSAATARIRWTAGASQPAAKRSGCQASPRRAARCSAASLLPPTQIGIVPAR
jgi:hypothetical protein